MKDLESEPTAKELLEVLFEYSGKIASERNLDNLLVLMNDMARKTVVCDRCTLWVVDAVEEIVWSKVAHGTKRLEMPWHKGIVGRCVKDEKAFLILDPYKDIDFNQTMDQKTGYKTRDILVVPIFGSSGSLVGIYQALNKKVKSFTCRDIERLNMVATFSGRSLESARLNHELEATQLELVHMLGEVGESRSKETANHVIRVGEYCHLLATHLGLPKDECELIRLTSPLHDLGKVAIPDAILNKPGKLTEEEFEVMKTHAALGYEILKKSPRKILRSAAVIAFEHQEKFNGRGYPRGLVGDEIHIHARICALADVFDALSHKRCYKAAWPFEQVVELFREERGEHFDPEIVDCFISLKDEFEDILRRYPDEE